MRMRKEKITKEKKRKRSCRGGSDKERSPCNHLSPTHILPTLHTVGGTRKDQRQPAEKRRETNRLPAVRLPCIPSASPLRNVNSGGVRRTSSPVACWGGQNELNSRGKCELKKLINRYMARTRTTSRYWNPIQYNPTQNPSA